jgi:hypothetical protein
MPARPPDKPVRHEREITVARLRPGMQVYAPRLVRSVTWSSDGVSVIYDDGATQVLTEGTTVTVVEPSTPQGSSG